MKTWTDLNDGDRVELGIVQVDIAGHSQLPGSDRALQKAKSIFRTQMESIATGRNGRLFNWAGDGGSFMFLTGAGDGFDDLAFASLQMLSTMSAINEEIATRTDLSVPLNVRISCDAGTATYSRNAGEITADFINRFLKYERTIGITNTVSITKRVWTQLTGRLRERFDMFKPCPEVDSAIYNYGGRALQHAVLKSLSNIDQHCGHEKAPESASCVEVVAFAGDTLERLSRIAYADVVVDSFENVGGINLLITKNGLLCQRHAEHSVEDDLDVSAEERHKIERLLANIPGDLRRQFVRSLARRSAGERREIMERLSREQDCYFHEMIDKILSEDMPQLCHRRHDTWRDPNEHFNGGESLRFHNTVALGYVPSIGDGTLLDNVFAGHLKISRVLGGVTEPVTKLRTFENRQGNLVETTPDDREEEFGGDQPRCS
jgi:hypothetical protein